MSKAQFVTNADDYYYNNPIPSMGDDIDQSGYDGEYERLTRLVALGDAADVFQLYGWKGLVHLYEATGDKKYLNDMLTLVRTLFSNASISSGQPDLGSGYFNDSYLGWYHDSSRNYSFFNGAQGQTQLYETERFTDIGRLLWVLLRLPGVRAESTLHMGETYQQHYDYILSFMETNYWSKWESRSTNFYSGSGTNSIACWMKTAWYLWKCTGTQKYYDVYYNCLYDVPFTGRVWSGLKAAQVPNNSDANAYQINVRLDNSTYQGRAVYDTGHTSFIIDGFINDYIDGEQNITLSDLQKWIASIEVFWPTGNAYNEFYYWLDGIPAQNSSLPGTKDPADTSGQLDNRNYLFLGWSMLGKLDSTLQTRFENVDDSYFYEARVAGAYWAEMAHNRAYIEDTLYNEGMTKSELKTEFDNQYSVLTTPYSKTVRTIQYERSNQSGANLYYTETLAGLINAFAATGDREYLNDVIECFDNFIALGQPSQDYNPILSNRNDSYWAWNMNSSATTSGAGTSGDSVDGYYLGEAKGFRKLAKLLYIMHNSPNLREDTNSRSGQTYQQHYDTFFNFIDVHIWDKWHDWSISQVYNGGADKDMSGAMIAKYFWLITGSSKYKTKLDAYNFVGNHVGTLYGGNFNDHIEDSLTVPGAITWDRLMDHSIYNGAPQYGTTRFVDGAHMQGPWEYVVTSHEEGVYWPRTMIDKFINTVPVYWPINDGTNWKTFIDGGSGEDDDELELYGASAIGRFDTDLQERFETADVTFMRASVRILQFSGNILYNRAYLDGTIQYPENYYSADPNVQTRNMPTIKKAFPTAYGAGSYTVGGRNGTVVHVSNLNSTGSGSLYEALLMTVPRTIVFDVSGVINLPAMYIDGNNHNVTIAGQTAPEGGITIAGGNVVWESVDEVIVRFIRFRDGATSGGQLAERDAVGHFWGNNIIYDHCSVSYGGDEGISFVTAGTGDNIENTTLQRTLITRCKTGSIMGGSSNAPETALEQSIHLNLYTNLSHRTPNVMGDGQKDVINNVVYNWRDRLTNTTKGDTPINMINNYYKASSLTDANGAAPENGNVAQISNGANPTIYSSGNIRTGANNTGDSWWEFGPRTTLNASYFTVTQHPLLGNTLPVLTAQEVYTEITNDVGANKYVNDLGIRGTYLDTYDTSRINNVINDTPDSYFYDGTNYSSGQFIIPTLPNNTRTASFYDSSNNIPEFFWDEHNITSDTEVKSSYTFDGIVVPNTAGYTAFEMWLVYAAQDDTKFDIIGSVIPEVPQLPELIRRKKAMSSLFINI